MYRSIYTNDKKPYSEYGRYLGLIGLI